MGRSIRCGEICAWGNLGGVAEWLEDEEGLNNLMDGYVLWPPLHGNGNETEGFSL